MNPTTQEPNTQDQDIPMGLTLESQGLVTTVKLQTKSYSYKPASFTADIPVAPQETIIEIVEKPRKSTSPTLF